MSRSAAKGCSFSRAPRTRTSRPSLRPWGTTAAGDSFRGALAVALAEGRTLKQSARRACAAAASSTVRPLPGGRARAGRPPAQR
ncbi:PfkB family carbohydrate kinase [Streptomyces fungicidicus]|uniref:PfkB family carbohydrate kinase n=1 Tax=Streptomyces fungicidicus TaxID=68203 RepID=UPI0033C9D3B5